MTKANKVDVREESIAVLAQDLGIKVAKVEVVIPFNYQDLLTEHKTKSGIIRFLSAQGYKNGPISKYMGIRFQHVRNVLVTPLKKVEA